MSATCVSHYNTLYQGLTDVFRQGSAYHVPQNHRNCLAARQRILAQTARFRAKRSRSRKYRRGRHHCQQFGGNEQPVLVLAREEVPYLECFHGQPAKLSARQQAEDWLDGGGCSGFPCLPS